MANISVCHHDSHLPAFGNPPRVSTGARWYQVADAARELRPDLKVLFVTGYAENAVLSHGHLDPGTQVVTKPFDLVVLADRIKGMIRD